MLGDQVGFSLFLSQNKHHEVLTYVPWSCEQVGNKGVVLYLSKR